MCKKLTGLIFLAVFLVAGQVWAKDLKVGEVAPPFTAMSDQGKEVSLQDFLGKTVILYFYPKDETPGCTIEAKGFKDLYPEFQKRGIVILGISYDNLESHRQFKADYQIPYLLLVDKDKKISEAYGAQGNFFANRETFVIDPQGNIRRIYRNVNPAGHAERILKDME